MSRGYLRRESAYFCPALCTGSIGRRKVAKTAGREIIFIKRGEIDILKKRALALANVRCMHFAKYYGLTYKKISVRAQKSRWGSCSRAGNLSFNYKIAALPPHIADYIIVHELCHLAEMNHSSRFWALVARLIPSHKNLRRELRKVVIVYRW
ncbi:M48 family peptidase [Candidatus Kaiserbacteria bacterium]|nr:M48 family peptidase [Candidatus Kaiserbacteria bacterium]